jgi:uncharacterized membrane protein
MAADDPLDRLRENATSVVSTLVTGIWLAALLLGLDWWLGFMLFGYIVIVPLTALLFGDEDEISEWWDDDEPSVDTSDRETTDEQDDALETLRQRYARGELTDEQFERKVEQLLETETLEDIEGQTEPTTTGTATREPESETN